MKMGVSNYELQAKQVHAKNLKGKLLLIHGGWMIMYLPTIPTW